jgi:hypothetical protein
MASPQKTGSTRHEIVLRHDQTCIKCRGKVLQGSRAWWDKATSLIEHVDCPPVTPIADGTYKAPPVTPDLWKRYCREIADVLTGKNSERKVIEEDRKAFETGGFPAMISSVVNRSRCTGHDAIEIVRNWIDSLKAPVDEAKFQEANHKLKVVTRV